MARNVSPYNPVIPTTDEISSAQAALARLVAQHNLGLVDEETGETTAIPAAAVALIRQLLADFAAGRSVSLIPTDAEISTFQAADILNVSRPYFIKLLDEGVVPYRLLGTHRRIRLDDVLAYKARRDGVADRAMDDLVAQAQELKMGY